MFLSVCQLRETKTFQNWFNNKEYNSIYVQSVLCVSVTSPLYTSVSDYKINFDHNAGLFLPSVILCVPWMEIARQGSRRVKC